MFKTPNDKLKFSIIIPTFNAERTISNTIESILKQDLDSFEVLICDGGSKDRTIEIVKEFQSECPKIYFHSEPDKGIYDAMNKGVVKSSGQLLYFMGADDIFYRDNILSEVSKVKIRDNAAIIYGDVMIGNNFVQSSNNIFAILTHNSMYHQSVFYDASIFNDFSYDVSLLVSADYELSLFTQGSSFLKSRIDSIIAVCGDDGLSSQGSFVGYAECMQVRKKYFPLYMYIIPNLLTYGRYIFRYVKNKIA